MQELKSPFRFCPSCAKEGGDFLRSHEYSCPACGFRYFHNVATAAGIVAERDGKLLFIVRGLDPEKGKLGLPGGFVDAGETVEHALQREVREEIGAEIGAPTFLASFPNRYGFGDTQYNTCDLYFRAEVLTAPEDFKLAEHEVSAIRWLAIDEVNPDDLAFASLRSVIALLKAKKTSRA